MKRSRFIVLIFFLFSLFAVNLVYADVNSILSLTVLPDPATVGDTVTLNWDMDLNGSGSYRFRAYIPQDWYSSGDWASGTDVTVSGSVSLTWVDSGTDCSSVSTGGVTLICNEWSATGTEFVESIQLSFTMLGTAVQGTNRPVRVMNNGGSGGTPNISTVYVEVQGAPTTRYVGNSVGDCAGNSPCDTGAGGLAAAISALPASGGTIVVSGQYLSGGANIGSKNIILQPLNGSSELRGDPICATGAPITLNGSGNLTIDGLTLNGTGAPNPACEDGIRTTGSGALTIQNSSDIDNWPDSGVEVMPSSSSAITINNSTFDGSDYGLFMGAAGANVAIDNSSFTNHTNSGLAIVLGTLTVENSDNSSNGDNGIVNNGGTLLARGNTFNNNTDYGIRNDSGSTTAYANSFSGNNGGSFQSLVIDFDDAAKNWWGSHSDNNVGPTDDGITSFAAGWTARLGAAVDSWAAGTDNITLGGAQLIRTGGSSADGVIISFGRASANAPFGNGVPPYVNQACSPFYDFYAIGSPTNWRVYLPIDNTPDCNSNVLVNEIAYTINDPANCTTPNNTACWDLIPATDILVSSNTLLIDNQDLSGTHFVSGDSSGALDPTAVNLLTIGVIPNHSSQFVILTALFIGLLITSLFMWRRKRQ